MRDRKIAHRYAVALLDAARQEGQVEPLAESYAAVAEAVTGNEQLRTFLESPQVADDEKQELLRTVLTGQVEPLLLNFLLLLLDKNRIEFLEDIGEEYALLVERERGFQRALVTTAVPLPADLEEALAARLNQITGRKILMKKRVDPAVVGGVCVVMEDQIIDGTVRTGLARVRQKLLKAPLR
ncbi:MAG: ATP synthase F1 subunit delta [Candidatus Krumholzibacteriia bacterium]